MFQGAPWPREGEPLYTQEDHDWFVALAEERRDTCPACGLLKAVCRDKARQFDFVVVEDQCNAARALADHQEAKKDRNVSQQRSMQVSIAFREGKSPPLDVGLDLVEVGADDVAAGPDGA